MCRYSEIGTKGRNREFFEERLCQMLQRRLASAGRFRFVLERGRIFALPLDGKEFLTPDDLELCRREVPGISGIASVSPGFYLRTDLAAIEECIDLHFPAVYEACLGSVPAGADGLRTYAMRVRRVDKSFPLRSEEMERRFARKLLPAHPGLKVDLENAVLVMELEIRERRSFLSFERIPGPGGLPAGSGGRVLALLSGGFDSPVACYQMMRRGCTVDFLTFHSDPYTPPESVAKVCGLVRRLAEYQRRGRMVAVNLLPAQKAVRDRCRSRYRTVLYRRFMLRIAGVVARRFEARALVTGDNLGQVASQTLENMAVIDQASEMMVLRPLLTYDKVETMRIAARIGTFELSRPYVPDSCTVFSPPDPATMATPEAVREEEAKLDVPALVAACLERSCLVRPRDESRRPFPELMELLPGT